MISLASSLRLRRERSQLSSSPPFASRIMSSKQATPIRCSITPMVRLWRDTHFSLSVWGTKFTPARDGYVIFCSHKIVTTTRLKGRMVGLPQCPNFFKNNLSKNDRYEHIIALESESFVKSHKSLAVTST